MAQLFIGTSGWSYDGWMGDFYPPGTPKEGLLAHYVQQFRTVEINATYYRMPRVSVIKEWHDHAPPGFLFSVKGHRQVTHYKKLKDVDESASKHINRVKGLGEHLGPMLWQLPPNLHADWARLDSFLEKLPDEYRHAVEFRNETWLNEEIFGVMRRHNATQVWISSHEMPVNYTTTADFVYIRFHGIGGPKYDYRKKELQPWADEMRKALDQGRDVFAYFNNDVECRAPKNAMLLREMMDD